MKKTLCFFGALCVIAGLSSCRSLSSDGGSTAQSTDNKPPSVQVVYTEIPVEELKKAIENVTEPGRGFIVSAYLREEYMGMKVSIWNLPYEQSGGFVTEGTLHTSTGVHRENLDRADIDFVEPPQYDVVDNVGERLRMGRENLLFKPLKIHIGVYFDLNNTAGYAGLTKLTVVDKIEGLPSLEEVRTVQTERAAAEKTAKETKRAADLQARERVQNPAGADRSQYRKITPADFNIAMENGALSPGDKVFFQANCLGKPNGNEYLFQNLNSPLTASHNFARDIPDYYFTRNYSVTLYLTVTRPGKPGAAAIDIIDWRQPGVLAEQ